MPAARRSSGFSSGSTSTLGSAGAAAMACSSARTAEALSGRWSGDLASSRRTRSSSARGISGRWRDGATGSMFRCWLMIATASSPGKGGWPVSIS
jgi:hypothetical protein